MSKKQQNKQARNEDNEGVYHVSVLLNETVDALQVKESGVYVDCTFGGGGHSREVLKRLGPEGKLVAFDQDPDAVANLPDDSRLLFIPQNFRHIARFLRLYGIEQVDGLMADLGVSSHQFDEGSRGFSYRFDAPLDMRMDQKQEKTAATVLNEYEANGLQTMFSAFGEVTNARTLAHAIVDARKSTAFESIQDLINVLSPLAKGNPNRYYSQVFQALRIEVNEELEALKDLLKQLSSIVKPGGRIAIITFHSLEDRIVKQYFRDGGFEVKEDPVYGKKNESPFVLINRKPIVAGAEELERNVRSRSASLRVAELK